MSKPRIFGEKYLQAVALVKSGEIPLANGIRVDGFSPTGLYHVLVGFGWIWNAGEEVWEPKAKRAKAAPQSRSTVFGTLPVSEHLALRIVTQSERIHAVIQSTKELYSMLDATLIKQIGPVPARKGKGKSMVYLYFALPR